jgi:PAS domain S-box-containing protein
MLDYVPCGLLVLTVAGTIVFANEPIARILGAEPSSLLGRDFRDFLSRGGSIFFETQFWPSLLLRRSLEEISFDLLCSDGHAEPVFVNAATRSSGDDGGQQILLAVFRARQRRLYESGLLQARRESERVSEIVRRSSDAIIRFAADGTIGSWNRGAQQIFGQDITYWEGKPLECLFAPEAREQLADALGKLRQGREVVLETRGLRRTGEFVDG